MRIAKWFGLGLITFAVLLLAFCEYMEYIENPKSYFSSYDDAKNSGIMDRGWIPIFIPKSSYQIHERHNIDSNRVMMPFKYDPQDISDVEKNCSRSEAIENGRRYFCEYLGSSVQIELFTDGTARLSSSYTSPRARQ